MNLKCLAVVRAPICSVWIAKRIGIRAYFTWINMSLEGRISSSHISKIYNNISFSLIMRLALDSNCIDVEGKGGGAPRIFGISWPRSTFLATIFFTHTVQDLKCTDVNIFRLKIS